MGLSLCHPQGWLHPSALPLWRLPWQEVPGSRWNGAILWLWSPCTAFGSSLFAGRLPCGGNRRLAMGWPCISRAGWSGPLQGPLWCFGCSSSLLILRLDLGLSCGPKAGHSQRPWRSINTTQVLFQLKIGSAGS